MSKFAFWLLLLTLCICQTKTVHSETILDRSIPGVKSALSNALSKELRTEILAMRVEDQSAREKLTDLKNATTENFEVIAQIDKSHNNRLKAIISFYGWPGIQLVGLEGSSAFWLLVQHQDGDLEFQKMCLELLKDAVANRDAKACDYAYLLDRVLKNQKLPQVYGTQWDEQDGKYTLYPVENPVSLDKRRLEVGLCSMEDYQEIMKTMYHLKDLDISP